MSSCKSILAVLCGLCFVAPCAEAGPGDLTIDGTYEAALDLPRILFLFKRDPNGPPVKIDDVFYPNYGFLDTGASGVVMSPETVDLMGLSLHPTAEYVDTGVAGDEVFDATEPLYVGTAGYETSDPCNPDIYTLNGPWRLQRRRGYTPWPFDPTDIVGIPVMAGRTVVFHPGPTNSLDFFTADIVEPNDPAIPEVDLTVPLRFERYVMPANPGNIPPLPVLAYNPVIDNITAQDGGVNTVGTWLFDSGGSLSVMSVQQGVALGLTDANGDPIGTPDFWADVGGIGGEVLIPGFQIDNLIVPTLNGYNLIYTNARVGVHDIGVYDAQADRHIILDGVFGSNFLCATMNLTTWDLAGTVFEWVVFDTQNATLGFDLFDGYSLPTCGDPCDPRELADLTGDCFVDASDLCALAANWLARPCDLANRFCDLADINMDGKVDIQDYAVMMSQWLESFLVFPACGTPETPCLSADLMHDGLVALEDMVVFSDEWLNDCDWLNWNCRGADLDGSGFVDLGDFALLAAAWLSAAGE